MMILDSSNSLPMGCPLCHEDTGFHVDGVRIQGREEDQESRMIDVDLHGHVASSDRSRYLSNRRHAFSLVCWCEHCTAEDDDHRILIGYSQCKGQTFTDVMRVTDGAECVGVVLRDVAEILNETRPR